MIDLHLLYQTGCCLSSDLFYTFVFHLSCRSVNGMDQILDILIHFTVNRGIFGSEIVRSLYAEIAYMSPYFTEIENHSDVIICFAVHLCSRKKRNRNSRFVYRKDFRNVILYIFFFEYNTIHVFCQVVGLTMLAHEGRDGICAVPGSLIITLTDRGWRFLFGETTMILRLRKKSISL